VIFSLRRHIVKAKSPSTDAIPPSAMPRNALLARRHLLLVIVLTLPVQVAGDRALQDDEGPTWRTTQIDPGEWIDGPVLEGSPMDVPIAGQAVLALDVSYVAEHDSGRVQGRIVIELFETWVPVTSDHIIGLADSDFYDGVFFHRVIDDFVTQSGDPECRTSGVYPTTSPVCGSGGSGQTIPLEHDDNMSHIDGAIGMARDIDPDSADSQWYICDGPQHGLDPENRDDEGYATFGVVRDGMSHVRAIAATPTTNAPLGPDLLSAPLGPDRPLHETTVVQMSMLGVVWGEDESSLGLLSADEPSAWSGARLVSIGLAIFAMAGAGLMAARPKDTSD